MTPRQFRTYCKCLYVADIIQEKTVSEAWTACTVPIKMIHLCDWLGIDTGNTVFEINNFGDPADAADAIRAKVPAQQIIAEFRGCLNELEEVPQAEMKGKYNHRVVERWRLQAE